MTHELVNLMIDKPRAAFEVLGHSIIARSLCHPPQDCLERIKSLWRIVAEWGRWCDDDVPGWPARDDAFAELPHWFRASFATSPFDFDNWLSDIHDREWIWGRSLIRSDSAIKVDLVTYACPISTWTIQLPVEKAGTSIVYAGRYVADEYAIT